MTFIDRFEMYQGLKIWLLFSKVYMNIKEVNNAVKGRSHLVFDKKS